MEIQTPHVVSVDSSMVVGGGESHFHMVGMKVSASYLILCDIALVRMRGVGAPCYSLVKMEA